MMTTCPICGYRGFGDDCTMCRIARHTGHLHRQFIVGAIPSTAYPAMQPDYDTPGFIATQFERTIAVLDAERIIRAHTQRSQP